MKLRIAIVSAMFLSAGAVQAQAYKIGDKVMVNDWHVELTENGQKLSKRIEVGDIFTVTEIKGDLLCVGRGWINENDVVRLDQAIDYFSSQIRHDPGARNFNKRAVAYAKMGKLDAALIDEDAAILLSSPNPKSLAVYHTSRGNTLNEKGEYDLAINDYNEAIALDPELGDAYVARAVSWQHMKRLDESLADFTEAIRLDPTDATKYSARAWIWNEIGNYEKALDDCDEAIRLEPKCVDAYRRRAYAFNKKGNYDQALTDHKLAIELDPAESYSYDGRAWVWATCPDATFRDGTKAVESATKACELANWQNAYCLDTLAAAYAENGDFDSAVKWQTKALKMKPNEEEFQKGGNERLELYKSGKPYRDTRK